MMEIQEDAVMGRELEFKYGASPEAIGNIREKFSGFSPISMETTYYDTQDLKLSMHHWTLRRRMENGRALCTVKVPRDDGSRGEWEVESGNIMAALMDLCKMGAPWELMRCCAGGVYPLCGARFTRQAATLEIPGAVVELALDQGILTGRGREMPLCEVEVEYKSGSEAAALAFAAELAAEFGLEREPLSKFARARALALKG